MSQYSLYVPTVAYVQLSNSAFIVSEGTLVSACLVIDLNEGSRDCPYGYQFEVSLYTIDGSAGNLFNSQPSVAFYVDCLSLSMQ